MTSCANAFNDELMWDASIDKTKTDTPLSRSGQVFSMSIYMNIRISQASSISNIWGN